jgi:hypothetical protein
MRILYIKRAYNTRLHNQVSALVERGHQIILLLESPIEAGYNGPAQWNLNDVPAGIKMYLTGSHMHQPRSGRANASLELFLKRYAALQHRFKRKKERSGIDKKTTFLQDLKIILASHKVDLIITSNDALRQEDMRTVWVINALKGTIPVVYECQDILSDCFSRDDEVEENERFVNEEADAVIHTNAFALQWIRARYRIKKGISFPNYASKKYFSTRLTKLSARDGAVHLVYCGSVQKTPVGYTYPFARDLKKRFQEIALLGFPLHLHLGLYPNTPEYDYYKELNDHPLITFHPYLPFREMMQRLTRYDVALFPVELGSFRRRVEQNDLTVLDGFPLSRADTSKQYEYTLAGLPVLTAPLRGISRWLEKNNFGAAFCSDTHLASLLESDKIEEYTASVDRGASQFSMEEKIPELERFLWELVN